MLRVRPALVSVCFVCLLALTPQPAAKLCNPDIINNVQYLIEQAPDLKCLNCGLYTPTIDNYQKCPSTTMKCFADEFKVLIEEWKTVPFRGFRLNIKLGTLANELNQTESECLQCELFKEEKVGKFLKDLRLTLEMINFQHC